MPRAKLNPTDAQRTQVRQLASFGLKHAQICAIMKLPSVTTLRRYFRKDLASGRIHAAVRVRAAAYKLATSGKNPGSTMFWLKHYAHWSNEMKLEPASSRRNAYEPMTWFLHIKRPERPPDTLDEALPDERELDDPWTPWNHASEATEL